MIPVGRSLMDMPRADFRSIDKTLVRLHGRFRWLLGLIRPMPVKPHVHDFVRLARLSSPPQDVFDCSCGQRKTYLKDGAEVPSNKVLIDAGDITLENTPFGGGN